MHKRRRNNGTATAFGATRTLRFLFAAVLFCSAVQSGAISLQLTAGTLTGIAGAGPTYHSSFGTLNGLGQGTPSGSITMIDANFNGNTGALYTGSYGITVVVPNGHTASVAAYITTNFNHLVVFNCVAGAACTSSGNFNLLSTNAGAPTTVWAATPNAGGSSTASFGVSVSNANGALGFAGAENAATIHFVATDNSNAQTATADLVFDTPNSTIQDAVSIAFAQGTTTVNGGAACVVGNSGALGSDANFSLGTVDGLGVSTPTCGGLTAAVATGATSATYATSYKITPGFSGFNPLTTGATIVLTSAGFTNSSALTIKEGSSAAGMTTIPASGATHSFSTLTSKSSIERFLGLTILNNNGGAVARFAGADSALITFTMTVN
ncbi:MAG: hypothetical protein JWO20_715 [Candidatus Angelobacter sp.]|nr:hypothetical protein [Candidatus Angelobacter sp.]